MCKTINHITDGPMTDTEFQYMNTGTHARMNGEFDGWSDDGKSMYWAIVDKFNGVYKPPTAPAILPESTRRTFVVQKTWMTEEEVELDVPDSIDKADMEDWLSERVDGLANDVLQSEWSGTIVQENDEEIADWG